MQLQDDVPFDVVPVKKQHVFKIGMTVIEYDDADIIAFQASQKYVIAHLRGEPDRQPILDESLMALHAKPEYADEFVQIHRSTIVRLSDLIEVRRLPASGLFTAHLTGGQTFPVSRRYGAALRRMLRERPVV